MDHNACAAARHFDGEEEAMERACRETALRNGRTLAQADECENFAVGCPDCPFAKEKREQFAALLAEDDSLIEQAEAIKKRRAEVQAKLVALTGMKIGDNVPLGLTRAEEGQIVSIHARAGWTYGGSQVLEVFGRAAPLTKDGTPHKSWDVRWERQFRAIGTPNNVNRGRHSDV